MKLTKNFSLSEFASKDGADFTPFAKDNIKILAEQLQVIRDTIGKPITVNSGYRSEAHNRAIKGASNSYHVKGMAADITAQGMTPQDVGDVIERLMHKGAIIKGGLKVYVSWVHYDFRGKLVKF